MPLEARQIPIVMVCARQHPAVTYYARRGEAPPPCPVCGWTPNGDAKPEAK